MTMQRVAMVGVCLLTALAGGCGQVGFNIFRMVPEQTVQGDTVAHTLAALRSDPPPIPPFQIAVDLGAEARTYGILVTKVFVKSLTFDITATAMPSGDTDCWDFVGSLSIQVKSTKAGTALAPVTVATTSNPGCVQRVAMTVTPSVNIKPYIDEGFVIEATGNGIPPADNVSFNGSVELRAEPF